MRYDARIRMGLNEEADEAGGIFLALVLKDWLVGWRRIFSFSRGLYVWEGLCIQHDVISIEHRRQKEIKKKMIYITHVMRSVHFIVHKAARDLLSKG